MLGNDQRRIRLALALTMALPGTPVLMYGDEIGMGENLSLPGRIAVRGPMQWSPRHAGGFSTGTDAVPAGLRRAARTATARSTCSTSATSPARCTRGWPTRSGSAGNARNWAGETGARSDVGDPRVLAIETRWRDGRVVTLHNLSAEPAVGPPAGRPG